MNAIAPGNLAAAGGVTPSSAKEKVTSAAKEFESILLGQWLKDAESTFGSVPGSQEDDSGGEQMQEFAMQHIAGEITDRGGIGITPIVERALLKEEAPGSTPNDGGWR